MNRGESQRAFQDTFDIFDVDGNGTIDIIELQLGLSKKDGINMSMCVGALEDLLKKFDANKNGVLERDEFISLMHSPELEEFYAQEDAKANTEKGPELDLDLETIYNHTPTPEETPTLIKEKLIEFNQVLNAIDNQKKMACMMAQEESPDLIRDDFKLAFLRCEVFRAELAVNRWIKYWDLRLGMFGEEQAFLPMTLEGAMKGREKAFYSTYLSVAEGVTDPDGRAIVLWDFREEKGDLSDDDLMIAVFYQVHVCLSNESAQKKGVVHFIRCVDKFFDGRQKLWKTLTNYTGVFPLRMSAVHYVEPPNYFKVLIKIVKLMVGPRLRNRIYVHSGSMDVILKSLSKFGLGSKDKLPEVFGGGLSFSPRAQLAFGC